MNYYNTKVLIYNHFHHPYNAQIWLRLPKMVPMMLMIREQIIGSSWATERGGGCFLVSLHGRFSRAFYPHSTKLFTSQTPFFPRSPFFLALFTRPTPFLCVNYSADVRGLLLLVLNDAWDEEADKWPIGISSLWQIMHFFRVIEWDALNWYRYYLNNYEYNPDNLSGV